MSFGDLLIQNWCWRMDVTIKHKHYKKYNRPRTKSFVLLYYSDLEKIKETL